jgi:hypothetical protein
MVVQESVTRDLERLRSLLESPTVSRPAKVAGF